MKTPPKPLTFVPTPGEDGETVDRPVRFGFNAVADFCEQAGLKLSDLQTLDLQTLDLKALRALYWAGFKDGARKNGEPFSATPEDVGDWIDGMDTEASNAILAAFASAQGEATDETPGKPKTRKKATP